MMGLLWENKITREEITKCLSGIILVCDLSVGDGGVARVGVRKQ